MFLNNERGFLLLVNADSIRYDVFLRNPYKNIVFDLDIFLLGVEPVLPMFHDSYFKSSPWLDLPEDPDNDVKKIITFTRHIRQNILITPFETIRIWSLSKKCILLSSIKAKEQHIMAFSKSGSKGGAAAENEIENNKLTTAYSEENRVVNI